MIITLLCVKLIIIALRLILYNNNIIEVLAIIYLVSFQLQFVDHEPQNKSVDSCLNQQTNTLWFPNLPGSN